MPVAAPNQPVTASPLTRTALRRRAALATAWALGLLVVSIQPAPGGALAPAGPFGLVGADKWLHAGGYGALAALFAWSVLPSTRRAYLLLFALVAGYGGAIELLQVPVATRSGDLADALANGLGAAASTGLWYALDLSARLAPDGDGPSR